MAVRLALLGLLAWLTLRQEATFADNVTLWRHAVAVNTTEPRPAYNLAVSLRIRGEWPEAVLWFLHAADRSTGRPEEAQMRRKVAAQLDYLEMFGHPVCSAPSVQPYCS